MGNLLAKLRWKRTDGRPASEQPTEDEGIRRDIPEPEYEKSSEKLSEAVSKQESIPEKTEPVTSPPLVKETESSKTEVTQQSQSEEKKKISKTNTENIQGNVDKEPEVSVSNETEIEKEDDNLEAVVKIQAGIRGYLTRKTLKEQRESVSPNKSPGNEESHKEVPSENSDITPEKVILQSTTTQEIPINLNDEDDVKKAAVKIQSVYRGYITRKNLSNIGDELTETSDDIANQIEENKDISLSEKEVAINTQDNEEVKEDDENGALEQAAVKIQSTFRGYQVRKQRKNGPKKEETKDSLTDNDEIQEEESELLELNDSEAEGKAAVKIQAMYRGYKVRKEIKMIGEDGNEEIETTEIESGTDDEMDDGILRSKTTIVLSTPADNIKKAAINEEQVLISFDTDSVQPTAESPSLLDENDEQQCLPKPMVPISNETTIPKSVSEPTVDINSVTRSKDDHLISPSSD